MTPYGVIGWERVNMPIHRSCELDHTINQLLAHAHYKGLPSVKRPIRIKVDQNKFRMRSES